MGDHHHGPAKGLSRWLYTTNHKDIGTMYLWFSFAMFLLGGAFAMIIRAELFQPGMQLVEPGFFNQMTTLHLLSPEEGEEEFASQCDWEGNGSGSSPHTEVAAPTAATASAAPAAETEAPAAEEAAPSSASSAVTVPTVPA